MERSIFVERKVRAHIIEAILDGRQPRDLAGFCSG
jgi:hypothetical protein